MLANAGRWISWIYLSRIQPRIKRNFGEGRDYVAARGERSLFATQERIARGFANNGEQSLPIDILVREL